ncbi:hypothetical protein OG607_41030 [Streptomyces sp. NBC_01537]|uniref:hypothetical protein n=1 Tax=Streptomyces sp. NBC_01537 TaxID=2903896 RepID=UPI00386F59FA
MAELVHHRTGRLFVHAGEGTSSVIVTGHAVLLGELDHERGQHVEDQVPQPQHPSGCFHQVDGLDPVPQLPLPQRELGP